MKSHDSIQLRSMCKHVGLLSHHCKHPGNCPSPTVNIGYDHFEWNIYGKDIGAIKSGDNIAIGVKDDNKYMVCGIHCRAIELENGTDPYEYGFIIKAINRKDGEIITQGDKIMLQYAKSYNDIICLTNNHEKDSLNDVHLAHCDFEKSNEICSMNNLNDRQTWVLQIIQGDVHIHEETKIHSEGKHCHTSY